MREAVIEYWEGADRPSMDNVRDPEWLIKDWQSTRRSSAHLFEVHAERKLIQPTLIYDFPVEVSPLSKNKPDEPALVERFEIIIAGMEIGNALHRVERSHGTVPPLRRPARHARTRRRGSASDG